MTCERNSVVLCGGMAVLRQGIVPGFKVMHGATLAKHGATVPDARVLAPREAPARRRLAAKQGALLDSVYICPSSVQVRTLVIVVDLKRPRAVYPAVHAA